MGKVVGIDLGTTNSVVSVIEGGKPVVIANAEGMRTTPSVVAFSKDGERLVGQMARRQTVLNPQNTFYNVKRYIGRKYTELSSDSKRVPYTVRKDDAGNVKIRCPRLDKDFAPEEVSAMVLRKLAEEASRYIGQPVTGAVITVPAYFNDAQRQATRDAGRIAGLEVKRIINEPTAAALAYGLDQQFNQTILVFDLGGGTFDVSILDVRNGVFEVKSTSGDTQLGGVNFDKKIVDWLADEFLEKEGIDLRRDRQALQRLTEAAEKAKVELSGLPTAEINLPFITATADGPQHIETKLSRSQFETLCADLIGRLRSPVQQAMNDARLSPSQIDEIVLVGGSSRMPMVQQLVRSMLSKEPSQNVNPDEAVAVGAAVQAGILTEEVKDIMLLDVTPLSLGLETIGGVMKKVIPRNTTIPVRRSDVFSTSENNQTVVEVHILQGEREMGTDNKSLGRFKLMGIPPAPRGIPQVQVAFDIDANGILQVSAMDKTTGREQSITVQEASNLSEDDIQQMLREAEEFADVDRGQRERIEKRNRSETLTFQAERAMRSVSIDFGLQFARDRKRRIDNLIQDLRDALKREDERMIDMIQSELQDELYELNREAYLYNADNDDSNILGQIGDTIKKAFDDDDDDYYRRDNDWNGQNQWPPPVWNADRPNGRNRWDDWDSSWTRPPVRPNSTQTPDYNDRRSYDQRNPAPRYDAQQDRYGQDATYRAQGNPPPQQPPYRQPDTELPQQDRRPRQDYGQGQHDAAGRYESGRPRNDAYNQSPSRDSSRQDYGQNTYSQEGYDQEGYGQEISDQRNYGQRNYSQGTYGQDSSGQGTYGQGTYGQGTYGQSRYESNNSAASDPDRYDQRRDYDAQDRSRQRRYDPGSYDAFTGGDRGDKNQNWDGRATRSGRDAANQSSVPADNWQSSSPMESRDNRQVTPWTSQENPQPYDNRGPYGSVGSDRDSQSVYGQGNYGQDPYRAGGSVYDQGQGKNTDRPPASYSPENSAPSSQGGINQFESTPSSGRYDTSSMDDPWADDNPGTVGQSPQDYPVNPGRRPPAPRDTYGRSSSSAQPYDNDEWGDQDENW